MGTFFKNCCKKVYYFAVISLLLFSLTGNAQKLILKNFNVKNGLPSAEIYCVFQDSKGFIWFGSDGGVSKFDGYTFKNYTTEDGLADNVVFEIKEDKNGRIWFRSLSGKLCYIKNDSIIKIEANELISQNIKNAIMASFYIDSGDTLWCGLKLGSGYLKISPPYKNEDFRNIKIKDGLYLLEIENNNFITGSAFYGQNKKWSSISFYKKQNLLKQINIPNLNGLSIGYSEILAKGFLIDDEEKLFSIIKDTVRVLLDKKQVFNTRTTLLKKAGNYTWLGLLNKGIIKCVEKEKFTWKKTEQILDGYSVSDVIVDNEGGTWFTTLENGVYYSSPAYFFSYQDYNELSNYMNYAIEKVGDQHFFMSNKLNEVDIISYDSIVRNVKISDRKITNLLEQVNESSIFINTGNNLSPNNFAGYLYDKIGHKLKKVQDSLNEYSLAYFFISDSSRKRNFLFTRHWLFTMHGKATHTTTFMWLPSRVLSIYKDKNGIIWLGCMNGLWSFEKNNFIYHGDENDYFKVAIEDIKEGADGTRYYATRGNGIFICKDGKYSKITTANGLSSNNCKCLYIDESNTVWVGSKNGLCKLKKDADGWQVLKFNLADNEFNYEVIRIEKIKNKLFVFTNKGLLSYELGNDATEFPPRIYIKQFSVNEVSYLESNSKILNYNQNFIKFSFIGLSFQSMSKIYYSYKLEGLDTSWHTTQNLSLQYPFLPPGDYTFYIKAISFSGIISKTPAIIHFTIKKPFWKTLWFILGTILFGICALYLLFYYRLKQIKKKESEKTLFNKQLAELEMKALRSQMNPHFIFNAINSIQNYIVKKDSITAQDYLAKFARLIRNVLENSKQENISLYNEIETLKLYIELEQLRAPDRFKFNLIVKPGLQLESLVIPPLILQPYIENAILHGLTPLVNGEGRLTISLEKKENKLICIIDDNGVGRKKAGEMKQKKHLMHKSMGLSVTEDRIKVINKLQREESSIVIEDKINEEGKSLGTKVSIVINLGK